MNRYHPITPRVLATLLALFTVSLAQAQQSSDSASNSSDTTNNDKDSRTKGTEEEKVTKLSPFQVKDNKVIGYYNEKAVEGSRIVQNIIDVPTSVTVINQEQIKDHNATSVFEALNWGSAGVTQNSRIQEADFNIRGFRSEAVMRDGQAQLGANVAMYDIDSIEVVKGPTNMLFGTSGFIGGAVNLITKQPTPTPKADANITFADHSYYRFAGNLSGPIFKSPDFEFQYRLTLGYLQADSAKEIEHRDQKFYGTALAFIFPKSESRFDVVFSYLDDHSYLYYDDFLDIVRGPTPAADKTGKAYLSPYSTESFTPALRRHAPWEVTQTYLHLIYTDQLSDNGNLRIQYQYTRNRTPFRVNPRGITVQPDNYTLNRQLIVYGAERRTQLLQVDYAHHLATRWAELDTAAGFASEDSYGREWIKIGTMPTLDVRHPDYASEDAYFANGLPNNFTDPLYAAGVSDTENAGRGGSYYLQEYLSTPNKMFAVTAGWRKGFPHNTSATHDYLANTTSSSLVTGKHPLQYKYGVVFKPWSWIALYATDAANVSSNNGRRKSLDVPGDQKGGEVGDTEGLVKEGGIKIDRQVNANTFVNFTAAYFKTALTNVQTTGFLRSGLVGDVWSAEDYTKGWEFVSSVNHNTGGGRISAIATASFGNSSTKENPAFQANDFVQRKWDFWGKYEWTDGMLKSLWIGGGVVVTGPRRTAYNYIIERPTSYSAAAGYSPGKHWNFQLNLDHIENKRYIVAIAAPGLVDADGLFSPKLMVGYKF